MVRPSCTLRVHVSWIEILIGKSDYVVEFPTTSRGTRWKCKNEPDNSKWGENCDAEADARGCLGQIAMPRCGVILLAFA